MSRKMSRTKLALLAALVSTPIVASSGASAETRYDLALQLGGAFGTVPERAQGVNPAAQATTVGTVTPFATGSDTVFDARGAIGGAFEAQLFDQGDGLPRLLLLAGANVFLGTRVDGAFATLHGGAAKDTGVRVSRPFTIDLGLGGAFPLCRKPSCATLSLAIGASLGRLGLTTWTDETADGGAYEEKTTHAFEAIPFLRGFVDLPLSAGAKRPVRLRLGLYGRSQPLALQTLTSGTHRVYAIGVDAHVEVTPTVGLVIAL